MYFQDYGVSFMETSAKTAQNVENAFMSVARSIAIFVWVYSDIYWIYDWNITNAKHM